MITLHSLWLGLTLALLAAGCGDRNESDLDPPSLASLCGNVPGAPTPSLPYLSAPSPSQSAALFIGVGKFDHTPNSELAYTVNDALDLANSLIEHNLVSEENVRLLLSGNPSGASSKLYDSMSKAIGSPTKKVIESTLRVQAAKVKSEGILYVFIATHGYSVEGQSYVMAKDSIPDSHQTAVSATEILEATRGSKGRIALFLDTCRVRAAPVGLPSPTGQEKGSWSLKSRGARPYWQEAMAKSLTGRPGYAVFFATGLGGISLSGESLNGIFTGAILNALHCKDEDATAEPRMVGLSELSPLIQNEVSRRSGGIQNAELLLADGFQNFLLFRCGPIGGIIDPQEHAIVQPSAAVQLQVCQSGLYPRAVIQAESNGVYYVQQPQRTIPALRDEEVSLPVDYGGPDRFQVYVGLGEVADFIGREETQIPELLKTDHEGRPIRWLGPVHVTFPKTE